MANNGHTSLTYTGWLKAIFTDLRSQFFKGKLLEDIGVIRSILHSTLNGGTIDDREFLLERIVGILSTLPQTEFNIQLSGAFIQLLWNDLPHPPATLVGRSDYAPYSPISGPLRYRQADGAMNSIWSPHMGQAGSRPFLSFSSQILGATYSQQFALFIWQHTLAPFLPLTSARSHFRRLKTCMNSSSNENQAVLSLTPPV
jgi:hypothetical protein